MFVLVAIGEWEKIPAIRIQIGTDYHRTTFDWKSKSFTNWWRRSAHSGWSFTTFRVCFRKHYCLSFSFYFLSRAILSYFFSYFEKHFKGINSILPLIKARKKKQLICIPKNGWKLHLQPLKQIIWIDSKKSILLYDYLSSNKCSERNGWNHQKILWITFKYHLISLFVGSSRLDLIDIIRFEKIKICLIGRKCYFAFESKVVK